MPPKRKPAPKKTKRPNFFMVLYGPGGCGKTTFATNAPSPALVYSASEDGVNILVEEGLIPRPRMVKEIGTEFQQWPVLLQTLEDLATEDSIKTVVVESVTAFELLAQKYHCETEYNGNWPSFGKYSRGPKETAKSVWPDFLDVLKRLRGSGKDIILTAHSTDKELTESNGVSYLKQKVYCDIDLWTFTYTTATAVCFLDVDICEDRSKKGLKKVAKSDFERHLHTTKSHWNDCKNWHGWEPIIALPDDPAKSYQEFQQQCLEKK